LEGVWGGWAKAAEGRVLVGSLARGAYNDI
jgi:hypothetical protein